MRYATYGLLILLSTQLDFARAQIRLPKLISDSMVLQRDVDVKVWGWASGSEKIELTFKETTYSTEADEEGSWEIILPAQEAGGPFDMTLSGKNKIVIRDILFGDVWVCSGQSNMELPMSRVKDHYQNLFPDLPNPQIRQFLVPDQYDFKQERKDLESGSWKAATKEHLPDFSAVGYFFAREIYSRYGTPIGLINAALGGSPVESWMSEETLQSFPEAFVELQKFKDDDLIRTIQKEDAQRIRNWYRELNGKDPGLTGRWQAPDFEDKDWSRMEIPGYWADTELGPVNGSVWFRKQIELAENWVGKEASLWLGRVVDKDSVYVNGEFVGTVSYQYPPRKYQVDASLLQAEENTLAIRVINHTGRGGFFLDKPYFLAAGQDTLSLEGPWKFKLGAKMPPLPGQTFIRWKPGGLFNAMIAPLLNGRIKGVLWYQGESNTRNPESYDQTFPALITNWRARWGQGDFPFLFVQLANFMEAKPEPSESNWATLRQAQLNTLSVPHTGMAVAIDLGEWNDIHPLNKQEVGKRLALLARKKAYGESDLSASSPRPRVVMFNTDEVVIQFQDVGDGLVSRANEPLEYFEISTDGKLYIRAKAEIRGTNAVVVWQEGIKNPVSVRYAWANNPATANLYSRSGLPASPFQLDKEVEPGN